MILLTGGWIGSGLKRDNAAETAAEEMAAEAMLEAIKACDSILFAGFTFRAL